MLHPNDKTWSSNKAEMRPPLSSTELTLSLLELAWLFLSSTELTLSLLELAWLFLSRAWACLISPWLYLIFIPEYVERHKSTNNSLGSVHYWVARRYQHFPFCRPQKLKKVLLCGIVPKPKSRKVTRDKILTLRSVDSHHVSHWGLEHRGSPS
jgi:hypothetical protein